MTLTPITTGQNNATRELTRDELAAQLPMWALRFAASAVKVRSTKRHCMIIARFDGLAFQLLEAEPVVKVAGE